MTLTIEDAHAATGDHTADRGNAHAGSTRRSGNARGRVRRRGEDEFVIVTVIEGSTNMPRRTCDDSTCRRRQRQPRSLNNGADIRGAADVPEIGNQTVGNIRRRMRNSSQAAA